MSLPNDAPPPYPGPSPFSPISCEETTVFDDAADSLRLPSYQTRTSRRYHPYLRVNNSPRNVLSRYEGTVYDESYTPLDIPLAASRLHAAPALSAVVNIPVHAIPAASAAPAIAAPLPPVNPPLLVQNTQLGPEEQHRQRVLRLFFLIPEFERAVRQALAAAQREKCRRDTKTSTDTDKPATN